MLKIERGTSAYGIGSNPRGGRYITLWLPGHHYDTIRERLVNTNGSTPVDGGPNPRFERLAKRLGKSPWDATDDEIISAWLHDPG